MRYYVVGVVLTWLGVLSASITFISVLDSVLKLARWAQWIAESWSSWVGAVWSVISNWISVELLPDDQFGITLAASLLVISIGSRLQSNLEVRNSENLPLSWQNILRWNVLAGFAIYFFYRTPLWGQLLAIVLEPLRTEQTYQLYNLLWDLLHYGFMFLFVSVLLLHWPIIANLITAAFVSTMSYLFVVASQSIEPQANADKASSTAFTVGCVVALGLLSIFFAPPRTFARRLIMVSLAVGTVVGLSALSQWYIGTA